MQTDDTFLVLKEQPWDDELRPGRDERVLNTWLSIWTMPRLSIRQIVQADNQPVALCLAAVAGLCDAIALYGLQSIEGVRTGGEGWTAYLTISPIMGVVYTLLFTLLSLATGRWLGGHASFWQVFMANAWAKLPNVCLLPLWLVAAVSLGAPLGIEAMTTETVIFTLVLIFGFFTAAIVAGIWEFVILLCCLSEVQRISKSRAFLSLILAMLLFLPLQFLLGVLVGFSLGSPDLT